VGRNLLGLRPQFLETLLGMVKERRIGKHLLHGVSQLAHQVLEIGVLAAMVHDCPETGL